MSQNDTGYFLAKAKANNAPNISGISEAQRAEILAWLQGAIYVWCQVNGSDQFAGFNLVGEKNRQWEKTPLYCLYKKHIDAGKDDDAAYKQAAIEVGHYLAWLTNGDNDRRDFTRHDNFKTYYSWDGTPVDWNF